MATGARPSSKPTVTGGPDLPRRNALLAALGGALGVLVASALAHRHNGGLTEELGLAFTSLQGTRFGQVVDGSVGATIFGALGGAIAGRTARMADRGAWDASGALLGSLGGAMTGSLLSADILPFPLSWLCLGALLGAGVGATSHLRSLPPMLGGLSGALIAVFVVFGVVRWVGGDNAGHVAILVVALLGLLLVTLLPPEKEQVGWRPRSSALRWDHLLNRGWRPVRLFVILAGAAWWWTIYCYQVESLDFHGGLVGGVAFWPDKDGSFVLAASTDTRPVVCLWDWKTRRKLGLFGHDGFIWCVAVTPNGRYAVTGAGSASRGEGQEDRDCSVRVWDLLRGQEHIRLTGAEKPVFSVAISPDGKHVLAGGGDGMRLWDIATGQLLRHYPLNDSYGYGYGHWQSVRGVAFSPDGRWMLSASNDNTVLLGEVETGRRLLRLVGHTDSVTSVAFSPDGRYVVSGSADRTVRLWDVKGPQTAEELWCYEGHTDGVHSVAFAPDGRRVLSGSMDGTVRLWEVRYARKAPCRELGCYHGHRKGVRTVAFSADGRLAASGGTDGRVRLWLLPP
jgi:WD40 repeat protein